MQSSFSSISVYFNFQEILLSRGQTESGVWKPGIDKGSNAPGLTKATDVVLSDDMAPKDHEPRDNYFALLTTATTTTTTTTITVASDNVDEKRSSCLLLISVTPNESQGTESLGPQFADQQQVDTCGLRLHQYLSIDIMHIRFTLRWNEKFMWEI